MEALFSWLLNNSIYASWLVFIILLMRAVFRRAPKWIHASLWLLVAIRLLLPFSIESSLSLVPRSENLPIKRVIQQQLRTPILREELPMSSGPSGAMQTEPNADT
ncbi:MAG: M56 family metallopeptidase [Tissierellia bacterium]|nr:M56 family metallopeptidase [Tissierellia bacterium]